MASLKDQYYGLSHRLRGIFTTLEAINNLMLLPDSDSEQVQALIRAQFEKGYHQIEEFRKLLERRAIVRDKGSQLILRMLTTLYIQVEILMEELGPERFKEILMEELNMTAREVQRMIDFNRDIERKDL